MPKTRERFEPWIERSLRKRFPELVAPLMDAVDAFDAIKERDERTQENLRRIVEVVSSTRRPLYENACEFMQELTAKWPDAAVAVTNMSKNPKSHIRFNAILCLGKGSPIELVDSILKTGLQDRSSRVRAKAADWAGRLHNARLIPELSAALAAENDKRVRATIEFELRLLRDGYILEKEKDGGYSVTVFTNDGTRGTWVNESRLESEGVEAIAASLRRT